MTTELSLASLAEACLVAARAHADQVRKGSARLPYILHPLEVARMAAAAGASEDAARAAVLHDVVEDSETTLDGLALRFGEGAARLVGELTDDPSLDGLPTAEKKARQAAHVAGISAEGRLLKLCDQTCNLRDLRAAVDAQPEGCLRDYLEGARRIARAAEGASPLAEAEFADAAAALERALDEGAPPEPRPLETGPAPGPLDRAGEARFRFLDAALHAARLHGTQTRKGAAREPYVNHVLEVAARLGGAEETLRLAALLHDAVEDTEATHDHLSARFGPEVAALVAEVSDDKTLPKAERKRLQIERAPTLSPQAMRLTLADKAANLASLADDPPADWPHDRRAEYLAWARAVAAPCRDADPALAAAFDAEAARLETRLAQAPA